METTSTREPIQGLAFDSIKTAVRIGFARSISERGMLPSQAEAELVKMGSLTKTAFGEKTLASLATLVKNYSIAIVLGGAIAGGATGIARKRIEDRIEGKGDPETDKNERTREGYGKMTADLKSTLAATAPEYKAPRTQEAMR